LQHALAPLCRFVAAATCALRMGTLRDGGPRGRQNREISAASALPGGRARRHRMTAQGGVMAGARDDPTQSPVANRFNRTQQPSASNPTPPSSPPSSATVSPGCVPCPKRNGRCAALRYLMRPWRCVAGFRGPAERLPGQRTAMSGRPGDAGVSGVPTPGSATSCRWRCGCPPSDSGSLGRNRNRRVCKAPHACLRPLPQHRSADLAGIY